MGFRRDGRELLVVIVKATYDLPRAAEPPQQSAEQAPVVQGDQFSGEPGVTAPTFETDYAHVKSACDVLLVGSAYAPRGQSARRTDVGLTVGPMIKRFSVVGHRAWAKNFINEFTPTRPVPFESLPITYDCAFGGTDRTRQDAGDTRTYLRNPVGRGYWHYRDGLEGQPLPNTEEINIPIDRCDGNYSPMALSPLGRSWIPRVKYAGTYDQQWIETSAPLWPDDFDERYFQAAPTEQTIPYPQGGESVVLENLTPDGYRAFQLPTRPMPMTFIPYKGKDAIRQAALDTIVLEPDRERFALTWRVTLPLARSVFDVKETVVGEMPIGWHRARQFPGKRYYASLGEAVEGERRRRQAS
jgi:hypothetical protein